MRRRSPDVEKQLLELACDQHHVRPQSVRQFASRIRIELRLLLFRRGDQPADSIRFIHPSQFHHAAMLAQCLADALITFLVLHVHPPRIRGNAQMVGHEEDNGVGIR